VSKGAGAGNGSVTDLDASTGALLSVVLGRAYQVNYADATAVAASDVFVANFRGNSVTQLPS
jgi:hypothetical protein